MEGKRPRGRPKLRWYDTVRRDLKAWKIKEEWATDRERWKGLSLPRAGRRRRKVRKVRNSKRKHYNFNRMRKLLYLGISIYWLKKRSYFNNISTFLLNVSGIKQTPKPPRTPHTTLNHMDHILSVSCHELVFKGLLMFLQQFYQACNFPKHKCITSIQYNNTPEA